MAKMKDSGIEWIGLIPENWTPMKLMYACETITDYTASGSFASLAENVKYLDEPDYAMLVRTADLSQKRELGNIYIDKNAYDFLSNSNLYGGEVILSNIGSVGSVYYYTPLYERSSLAPNAIMFRSDSNKYLYYLLSTRQGAEALNQLSNATTQAKFNKTQLRRMKVVIPPQSVQKKIVEYLDIKCKEIDDVYSDIEKQIEILEEYKKSVITEAVTKGLNPDVEMKDSGIEWIGDIPKDWNIHPVYYYFGERKNKNKLGRETNLLSLSYGNVIRKDINTNGGLLPENFNSYNIVEANDIIIRPTDLQNDMHSLRTGLAMEHGIITSAYIDLCPRENVNSAYFHYLLHAYDLMKVFYNMGNGVRQGLNYSEFSRLMVFEPTDTEQQAIVNYLDSKCSEIDGVIEDKKKQLETLEEYKKSLIYEYVTGKKEVPDNE